MTKHTKVQNKPIMTTKTSKNRPYTEYYQNGQKKVEGDYKDDKKDGKWTWWHEDGQKKKEVHYKDGKQDGKFTSWWHWNGGIESVAYFINGNPHGIMTYTDYYGDEHVSYYVNGELTRRLNDGEWEYTELGHKLMSEDLPH